MTAAMTRDAFLRTLRLGLAGLPPQEIEDIVADYEAHFVESDASGRSEAEVAAALGDPARIARELRAEAGLRRFEAHWSVSNMLAAAMALAGLAIVDILFLLPLLLVTIFITLGLAIALAAIGAVGVKIIFTTLLFHFGGPMIGTIARLLIGAGLVSCLMGGGALLLMGLGAGIRMLGHYARLHFRLAQLDQDRV
ncbi:putative membrane protein [Rhizobium sp. BK602]|nr:putative membrane protein [Rhizobium sp. BK602]